MPTTNTLLKRNNITLVKKPTYQEERSMPEAKELVKLYEADEASPNEQIDYGYGRHHKITTVGVIIQRPDKPDRWDHRYYVYRKGGKYLYTWAGNTLLASDTPIPMKLVYELSDLKDAELEASKEKRANTVKTPRDAVKAILRELGVQFETPTGDPRIECAFFSVDLVCKDTKIEVQATYRHVSAGDYIRRSIMTTLALEDPDFSSRLADIIDNCKNAGKILVGEKQPKVVKNER